MEGSYTDPEAFGRELDEVIEAVMPETWFGHARLTIVREAADLPESKRETALKVAKKLAERHPNKSTEKLAQVALEKVQE